MNGLKAADIWVKGCWWLDLRLVVVGLEGEVGWIQGLWWMG